MAYRYVLDCEVAESFLRLSARQRDELIQTFRMLAANPFIKGGCVFRDSSLREIQKQRFGSWLITFWADHALKEVRIVALQRAAR